MRYIAEVNFKAGVGLYFQKGDEVKGVPPSDLELFLSKGFVRKAAAEGAKHQAPPAPVDRQAETQEIAIPPAPEPDEESHAASHKKSKKRK